MLTNDQCKRLQKAGCPRIGETPINGRVTIYYYGTVEEIMGWMDDEWGCIYLEVDNKKWKAGRSTDDRDISGDWKTDALSALFDLWERLEAK